MLEAGGVPMGDYVPVPWLLSSAGWGAWIECDGPGIQLDLQADVSLSVRAASGPLRLHLLRGPRPGMLLRRYCELTGFPDVLPEWGYGHWKSRDVYAHERDVLEDYEGYRAPSAAARRDRPRLALGDAIQHVGVQPLAVPGPGGSDRQDALDRRPHRRLDDAVDQPRLDRRPAPARCGVGAQPPPAGLQLR